MEENKNPENKFDVFNTLYSIDTRDREQEKDTGRTKLSYLPWATVYSEIAKAYPDTEYEFLRDTAEVEEVEEWDDEAGHHHTMRKTFTESRPFFDTGCGYEVRTRMKVHGQEKEMNLPVYDATYHVMGKEPYKYSTKYGDKDVAAAKFDDIYKSIMRCFAKNGSMYGVGLNLWTKEEASDTVLKLDRLRAECMTIIKTKCKSDELKSKVEEVCKAKLPGEDGNPMYCEDLDKLIELKRELSRIK